jgi:ABC-2 type transport system permease protein
MFDAVRAEALKLHRHRATWMMVWIYPVVIAVVTIGVLIYGAVTTPEPADPGAAAGEWIRNSTMLWAIPMSAPGRFLIAGFAAVVFAGEYGWNTWKLIIPARSRWQLIAAKWVVAFAFVLFALFAADVILMAGEAISIAMGDPVPAGVTAGAVLSAHVEAAGHAVLPILYTIAFAALFAVLTQSILATVILSIALVIFEQLLPLTGPLAYGYLPGLTAAAIKFLPFYHMANTIAWAGGSGMTLPLGVDAILSYSWATSAGAVVAWIAGIGALTQFRFARQDLN